MIRDEFIKQQKEKNISNKEMQKIRAVGERVFYTTQINRIENYTKALNFSFIVVAILLVIVSAPILFVLIAGGAFSSEHLLPIIVVAVMSVVILSWFCIFYPLEKSKVKRYKKALEVAMDKQSQRQKIIFKDYIK